MFYSNGGCCDNRCDYRVMVARSKNLRSGWEQFSEPILEGGGQWLCPGHGTLVATPDNRYFYMHHSYHTIDFEYIGRQGMIEELIWDEISGWPHFKNGTFPSEIDEVPFKNTIQRRETVYYSDFSDDKDLQNWQWDLNKRKPEMNRIPDGIELSSDDEGFIFTGISQKPVTLFSMPAYNKIHKFKVEFVFMGTAKIFWRLQLKEVIWFFSPSKTDRRRY